MSYLIAPRYSVLGKHWYLSDNLGFVYVRRSVQDLLDHLLQFGGKVEVEIRAS